MKKLKFLLFCLICVSCVCFISVFAFAEEVVEETVEVTYQDQINDFWNKWGASLFAFVSGIVGSVSIRFAFLKGIKKRIDNHEKLTEEDYTEAKKQFNAAKQDYIDATAKITYVAENHEKITKDLMNDFNKLIENYSVKSEEQTKKVDLLLSHVSVLKDLLCKMVASNPELASNGYAQQIMQLCDETDLFKIKEEVIQTYKDLTDSKEGENNE